MRVVNGVKFWRAVQAGRGRPSGEVGDGAGAASKARAQVNAESGQRAKLRRRDVSIGGAERGLTRLIERGQRDVFCGHGLVAEGGTETRPGAARFVFPHLAASIRGLFERPYQGERKRGQQGWQVRLCRFTRLRRGLWGRG